MNITPITTRIFHENESLSDFIIEHLPTLPHRSVLVVTSKIIAMSEGRTDVDDEGIFEQRIHEESSYALKTPAAWLTIHSGMMIANAGIDRSNANGKIILLPKDSFARAREIRNLCLARYDIQECGVLITDSRLLPLRVGVVGIAVGYAGFLALRDYREKPDLFSRLLRMTQTNIADSLATAAVLCMGEGAESQPLALITDAPIEYTDKVSSCRELLIDPKDDLYAPLLQQ